MKILQTDSSQHLLQTFPVRFSVGCHGHPGKKVEFAGDHIFRKKSRKLFFQQSAFLPVILLCTLSHDHEGVKLAYPSVPERRDDAGLFHGGKPEQVVFNVGQFDAVAVKLDLQIDASVVKEHSILQISLVASVITDNGRRPVRSSMGCILSGGMKSAGICILITILLLTL